VCRPPPWSVLSTDMGAAVSAPDVTSEAAPACSDVRRRLLPMPCQRGRCPKGPPAASTGAAHTPRSSSQPDDSRDARCRFCPVGTPTLMGSGPCPLEAAGAAAAGAAQKLQRAAGPSMASAAAACAASSMQARNGAPQRSVLCDMCWCCQRAAWPAGCWWGSTMPSLPSPLPGCWFACAGRLAPPPLLDCRVPMAAACAPPAVAAPGAAAPPPCAPPACCGCCCCSASSSECCWCCIC
jgi:hypothetical protein